MRILTCPPDHFDVDYVINPWMEGQTGSVDRARARAQWEALFEDVARFADVHRMDAQPGSPDMCFTANAALVEGDLAIPARFRHAERRAEEAPFAAWLEGAGFATPSLEDPRLVFEGEGDALFQPGEPLLWAGYGVRTALESHRTLARRFGVEVVSLRLVDPRFYHLDTCFTPLPDRRVMYHPRAFDDRSRAEIEARFPADRRIEVSDDDAGRFACNALRVDDRLFANDMSDTLRRTLAGHGFEPRLHPVDEFLKAGGGVKCLSLLLDQDGRVEAGERGAGSEIQVADAMLRGHLLDEGILRRALDAISEQAGSFRVDALDLAERGDQASSIQLRVVAPDGPRFDRIARGLESLGAVLERDGLDD